MPILFAFFTELKTKKVPQTLGKFYFSSSVPFFMQKKSRFVYFFQISAIVFLPKFFNRMKNHRNKDKKSGQTATEMKIFVYIIIAYALMRDGKPHEACEIMNEALIMLDALDEPCILNYAAYHFMSDYYASTNRCQDAQKYQNLLREYDLALMAELSREEYERLRAVTQRLKRFSMKNIFDGIMQSISSSKIEENKKKVYIERLSKLDLQLLENAYKNSKVKISPKDVKFIICFAIEMDTNTVSTLFNVKQASVHTMRYRIRKKFAGDDNFRIIF